ncbi:SLAM family member 6 [Apodemus speciosus]|uniref:SLAM family member 6 n=1 Tax=Apodemus speciosus TaxID=105296 RepID=A0ABQ0EFJ6_APOSI
MWSEAAGRNADSMVVNGILGESVIFPLMIQESQKIDNIALTAQSSVAFIKLGVNKTEVTVTQVIYKGRIEVIGKNYDLVIRDLRMEDAGTYKADINEEDPEETITKIYHLQIYRRLEKPKITQSLIPSLNNTCNVTLTCTVEKEEKNVTYSWSPSGEKSNVLQIFHSPMDQKLTYTCTAQNPVSNNSDSVTVQQPCTDTPSFHPRHAVLQGGLAVLFLFILIIVLVLLFHLYKRRQSKIVLEADDVSKKTVYAIVSRNAHPTESRIYDEITQTKMGKANKNDDERPPKTLGNEVSRSSSDLQLVNGILGESAVLPLELPAGKMASVIVWSYEGEASQVTTILIIHLNASEKQVIKADRKREKRLDITQSYSLQLSNLTMTDTGSYSVQITTEDSEPTVFKYTLRVFERLSSLEVANHTLLLENGTCRMHLACLVKNPNRTVSVEWQAAGNDISLGEPNVTISWDPRNSSDQTYICRAENAVSNLSVSVSTQSLCKGILTNTHWNTVWLAISISMGVLILIFVCMGIYVWQRRRGSLPLTSQHADSSQSTDAPGSPGNTVYAQVTRPVQEMKIPKPIKNDSMTIYSIVNHCREWLNTLKDIKLVKDFKEIRAEHIY